MVLVRDANARDVFLSLRFPVYHLANIAGVEGTPTILCSSLTDPASQVYEPMMRTFIIKLGVFLGALEPKS